MPRYFFDVQDRIASRDEDGVECADLQSVAREVKRLLPALANDEVPKNGEHQALKVLVTDEDGYPVYSASLSYVGTWLIR